MDCPSQPCPLVLLVAVAMAWGDHVAFAAAASAQQDARTDPASEDSLEELPLQDLVDLLPAIRDDVIWDDETVEPVPLPPVAELERRLDAGETMTDELWRKALLRSRAIRARPRWPAERPYAVSMRSPWSWLGIARIQMVPRRADLESAAAGELFTSMCGFGAMGEYEAALYQELGTLPPGRHSLVFDVTVERGRDLFETAAAPPGVVWRGPLTLDVEVVGTLDEAIPPVRDAALDAAVRSSVCLAYETWWIDGEWRCTAMLVIDPDPHGFAVLDTTALSVEVEVLWRGRVVETTHLVADCYDTRALVNTDTEGPDAWMGFTALRTVPFVEETGLKDWSVRLAGTQEDVLPKWNARWSWAGRVTVPLDEARARERQRVGTNRRSWVGVFYD